MNKKHLFFLTLGLLFLFSCSGPSVATAAIPSEGVEHIIGYLIDNEGIIFQVASGGCTEKEHFKVYILKSLPVQVQLIRQKKDHCEAFIPYGVKLHFTYEEMGLSAYRQFKIANPLGLVRIQ